MATHTVNTVHNTTSTIGQTRQTIFTRLSVDYGHNHFEVNSTAMVYEVPKNEEDFIRILANQYIKSFGIDKDFHEILKDNYPEEFI